MRAGGEIGENFLLEKVSAFTVLRTIYGRTLISFYISFSDVKVQIFHYSCCVYAFAHLECHPGHTL